MIPKITLIGSGNLAFHLARRFKDVGNPASTLVVRNKAKAEPFSSFLDPSSSITTSGDLSYLDEQIFIIAVTDSAISDVLINFKFPSDAVIVHTSGSQGIDVFHSAPLDNFGVIYPLQTFSKDKHSDFANVPIFVEYHSNKAKSQILKIANLLSPKVSILDSPGRLKLHLAAVLACNFSNALYKAAQDQLLSIGLSFDLLHPLIRETTEKAILIGPEKAQTGPANRGDIDVINKHLAALEKTPEINAVYDHLSKFIANSKMKP